MLLRKELIKFLKKTLVYLNRFIIFAPTFVLITERMST